MQLDPIPKESLKTGDILLCNIPELSFLQYLETIVDIVKEYRRTNHFSMEKATPLIHWIIGVFDGYHYCHASFWNGEKVVESRIKGGLRANDISTYSEDTVDVYRYHRDGHWVGDRFLPVEPLLEKAQSLVDLHLPYGFDSAYMVAILCVTRWPRAKWVDNIRDLLVHHGPAGWEKMIDDLFQALRPQIDALIEALIVQALKVVQKYLDGKGYVCSQTVAIIYNEADDGEPPTGRYKIVKPSYSVDAAPKLLAASPNRQREELAACEDLVGKLRAQLEQLKVPADKKLTAATYSDYEEWQTELRGDSFYTPRDLAQSSNTELVGRLKL